MVDGDDKCSTSGRLEGDFTEGNGEGGEQFLGILNSLQRRDLIRTLAVHMLTLASSFYNQYMTV